MDVLGDQLLESVTFDYFWILDGVWLETDGLFGKTVPRLHRFLNSNGVIYVPLFLGTLRSMYVNTKYWKSLFEVTLLDEKDLGTVGVDWSIVKFGGGRKSRATTGTCAEGRNDRASFDTCAGTRKDYAKMVSPFAAPCVRRLRFPQPHAQVCAATSTHTTCTRSWASACPSARAARAEAEW